MWKFTFISILILILSGVCINSGILPDAKGFLGISVIGSTLCLQYCMYRLMNKQPHPRAIIGEYLDYS